MSGARFDDVIVPMDHEWVTKYRMPCVAGFYTNKFYPVSLAYPCENVNDAIILPTDAEVELLSEWSLRRLRLFNSEDRVQEIRKDALDIEPGVNTYSFGKDKDAGWLYRAASWRDGEFPNKYNKNGPRFWNLIDALDHFERHGEGWLIWKEEHSFLISATLTDSNHPEPLTD